METVPFEVRFELDGWALLWAELETGEVDAAALAELRARVAAEARERLELPTLAERPAVAGLRKLFRAAGCDPTRYRPSSEALVRRLLKGAEIPAIHPLVDLNNCLSARLLVPCCVMREGTVAPPYVLRAGAPNESYASLRGPFKLESKPLLADAGGPCDAPITGSERVKVVAGTTRAALVAYLPEDALSAAAADAVLGELIAAVPGVRCHGTWAAVRSRA